MSILFEWTYLAASAIFLLFYWLVLRGRQARLLALSLFSLACLVSLHPLFGCLVIGIIVVVSEWVKRWDLAQFHTARSVASIVVAIVVLLLGLKYGPQLLSSIRRPGDWVASYLVAPLGISYFCVRLIQYGLDCYRGLITDKSVLSLASFLLFLPALPAGPIETFQRFHQNRIEKFDSALFGFGLRRLIWGYFKKLFVVELMLGFISRAVEIPVLESKVAIAEWLPIAFAFFALIRAYLDLSAYTDIAIGLSALFGFRLQENFYRPFLSRNLSEFWHRWHISLATWCRNQVYFPLFGRYRMPLVALLASMVVMGLWHQLSWNWLAWGSFHALGLILFSIWRREVKKHPTAARLVHLLLPRPVAIVFTLWYVALGFVFVSVPDFSQAVQLFVRCFLSPFKLVV